MTLLLAYTTGTLFNRRAQHISHSHRSNVHHVYCRTTALSSCLFYILQSQLALRQFLRFALRYVPKFQFSQIVSDLHHRHVPLRTFPLLTFEWALLTLSFPALQTLLALLPFFLSGHPGTYCLLLSFHAYVPPSPAILIHTDGNSFQLNKRERPTSACHLMSLERSR